MTVVLFFGFCCCCWQVASKINNAHLNVTFWGWTRRHISNMTAINFDLRFRVLLRPHNGAAANCACVHAYVLLQYVYAQMCWFMGYTFEMKIHKVLVFKRLQLNLKVCIKEFSLTHPKSNKAITTKYRLFECNQAQKLWSVQNLKRGSWLRRNFDSKLSCIRNLLMGLTGYQAWVCFDPEGLKEAIWVLAGVVCLNVLNLFKRQRS